ncbi:glycoside hydrolase family 3 C-terminal domain-containing protein [Rhizobium bangladeshense]|uniref:glycoside hydrolase family 3 C-terminal domain-containing protein n=1 Tax=Rhizobium bangladeshense TaxID=1138189 RepID=UPI001A99B09F|nr:glycoside hydrolase family 3 C-terminal domain-containing protein [Rhizobium bangladeshense]MBX4905586.1 beta-glucosidase [Rhizobium bangladeshense]MBX4915853.1 beta-glucosidase [Rhizobium bangladeshense]MBX4934398.1 beta-glucosidase [Rhizobium bangladeshense]QSY90800.1 glycoside hydrolase family 3 C-terminal domain-containing protein [Rhizobium bangladeshense]QSY96515.1 glycoside hydrolase family 3 C-terminal domain-containing protein [Rhizobium bangladeshense]
MIDSILDKMTLEEQVALLSGADFWTTVPIERLGVPKIKVTDGPNGARGAGSLVAGVKATCFPVGIALGATWNPDLVKQMGVALARQAKSKGAAVLLAPTVNIHRSGLNGRNFECYSEDPMLTAELAVAYIAGVQGEGVAATIKHFAGNESEIERQTMSSDIDERTLREIYLPPFEQAVRRAGVLAVMSSYNRLNGTYTSEHHWLLTKVLRQEWGFDGIVMSDWFGSHSTAETINAGLDLEMPGPARDRGEKLVAAVHEGKVEAATVRAAARRILLLLERVGAFEGAPDLTERAIDLPEDRALIRRLGAEGAVLLKNDGILPLAKTSLDRIAVIGPNAASARVMGGGSAQIAAHYTVSPLEGIRAALSNANSISHAVGCRHNRLIDVFKGKIKVEYFTGRGCKGDPLHVETVDKGEFFWFELPAGELDPADFSARMTMQFAPEESGEHVFGMTNAGLARLFVDRRLTVEGHDGWTRGENYFGTANDEQRGTMTLEAGRSYEVIVEYEPSTASEEGINLIAVRFGVEKPLGEADIEGAVETARNADVALVFVGRDGEWDTEGLDLPDMRLPGRQEELIEKAAAANANTVVVLQTGGPIEMPWLGKVRAVLQMWYPGQELGNAVADVLFGDVEPGGRLPQTFPKVLTDNSAITGDPAVYPGKDGHVRYAEGIFVGYRHHDTREIEPLFPFGFGLGYTSFRWSEPQLSARQMGPEGITVSVDVTNTGDRPGSELVQLYVRSPRTKVERPDKELRAFAKLSLQPGETGTAVMKIMPRDLAYFDIEVGAFRAEPGGYQLVLAANAADIRSVIDLPSPAGYVLPPSPA